MLLLRILHVDGRAGQQPGILRGIVAQLIVSRMDAVAAAWPPQTKRDGSAVPFV